MNKYYNYLADMIIMIMKEQEHKTNCFFFLSYKQENTELQKN